MFIIVFSKMNKFLLPILSFHILILIGVYFFHDKIYDVELIVKKSIFFIINILLFLMLVFFLFNIIEIFISIILFKNTKISFLNICYNKKIYFDNSLENIFIGKNGPKIKNNTTNKMLINEIKKFEKYKIYILIFLILLFSIIYMINYSNFFLIILIALDMYFIIITIIYLKYKEEFIQNKGLTLAIYQNKISPYIFETNEDLEIFKLESNIDMELYLKIKILYYNNNFKFNDIAKVEKLIKDKNIFYLLYSETIDVLSSIKNDSKYNYKFDNIYKNKYLIDNKFSNLQKAVKENDINSIKEILPYRYRIIID